MKIYKGLSVACHNVNIDTVLPLIFYLLLIVYFPFYLLYVDLCLDWYKCTCTTVCYYFGHKGKGDGDLINLLVPGFTCKGGGGGGGVTLL